MRKLLIMLGVPIDDLTMEKALDRLEEFIAVGRATGKCHQVATINADFVVNALRDPELRYILQGADMSTADGMPLVWGARLLGVPLAGRVTGADMVPALAERAAQKGYSLFLLGAGPGVAAQAARVLQTRYPGLIIAGTAAPHCSSVLEMDHAVLAQVQAARPDILLVAFGNPKQEKWISLYGRDLGVPLSMGVGGTLDIIAGVSRRAPGWMQRAGCEWLFRLLQEPQRLWKRYMLDLVYFGYFFIWQLWVMHTGRAPSTLLPRADLIVVEHTVILTIQGRLDVGNQAEFLARADQALQESPFLIVDLGQADFLDSSALGALVALANRARNAGGALWLTAVPPQIERILTLLKLDQFFEIHADVAEALVARRALAQSNADPAHDYAGWMVVKMPRMLDTAAARTMTDWCTQNLARNPQLILDFSETVLLSSAGLSGIIQLNRMARAQGGEVRMAGCSAEVLYSLRQVQLDRVLPLFSTVQAAATA